MRKRKGTESNSIVCERAKGTEGKLTIASHMEKKRFGLWMESPQARFSKLRFFKYSPGPVAAVSPENFLKPVVSSEAPSQTLQGIEGINQLLERH